MSPHDPPFARVPERLVAQLERGQLSFGGFGLRVYLIRRANWYTREVATTSAALRDSLHWPWTERHLRDELHKLAPDFSVEPPPRGQHRGVWIVRIEADDFGPKVQPDTPQLFELDGPHGTVMEREGGLSFHEGEWKVPDLQGKPVLARPSEKRREKISSAEADDFDQRTGSEWDPIARLVAMIRDADEGTERVFSSFKLPPAAYHSAAEALEARRRLKGRNPLTSEAKYVCSLLKEMKEDGRYAA